MCYSVLSFSLLDSKFVLLVYLKAHLVLQVDIYALFVIHGR